MLYLFLAALGIVALVMILLRVKRDKNPTYNNIRFTALRESELVRIACDGDEPEEYRNFANDELLRRGFITKK